MFPVERLTLFEAHRPTEAGGDDVLITVAVSLYNYSGYITECLDSVVSQTHRRIDLIVVDDGSTDDSPTVAADWLERNQSRFERALLIRHGENQGLSQTRNTAFEAAQADYVFVLDADNVLYPRAIARLFDSLEDSGAGAAYSQLVMFGGPLQPGYADIWTPDRFKPANYVDAMALVSKSAWATLNGYAHMDYGWEDYDFWCRFVEHGITAIYTPEILARYRIHHTSMLRTDTDHHNHRVVQQMMFRHPWLELAPR